MVTKERFGTTTALYHNLHYTSRQQLGENRLGTSSTDANTWNRGGLINYYSNQARTAYNQWLNTLDNNGNVTRVQHFVPMADVAAMSTITPCRLGWRMGVDPLNFNVTGLP